MFSHNWHVFPNFPFLALLSTVKINTKQYYYITAFAKPSLFAPSQNGHVAINEKVDQ